jgi:peptide/nickel transport system substrate-binding protein
VLTDLLNGQTWTALDPARNSVEIDGPIMSAIYGELFEAGPGGTVVPDEAQGYSFSDNNLQFNITIRHGEKFSDGTAFNAAAVAASLNRDLLPANACQCLADFSDVKKVTAPSEYVVQLTLAKPYAPLVAGFIDDPMNWTVDPTALAKMGQTAYGLNPVGAGPFKIVSNEPGAQMTLTANTDYWEAGHPYLSGLKFVTTASDESDLVAIQAGGEQLSAVSTVSVWQKAQHTTGVAAYEQDGSSISFVRINNSFAPFGNKTVREAIAYATNAAALVKYLYADLYTPIQGFTSPYMLFYEKTVPGYRAFDLAKAKQLVKSIPGGVSFTELVINIPSMQTEAEALASQWEAAGMKVTVDPVSLQTVIAKQISGAWGLVDSGWGGCDLDPGACEPINLTSTGAASGIKSPALDALITKAAEDQTSASRDSVYDEINQYLNTNADYVWLYAQPILMIKSANLEGVPLVVAINDGPEDFENIWVS